MNGNKSFTSPCVIQMKITVTLHCIVSNDINQQWHVHEELMNKKRSRKFVVCRKSVFQETNEKVQMAVYFKMGIATLANAGCC